MSRFEEIVRPVPPDDRPAHTDPCPADGCGGELRWSPIQCPTAKFGCMVLHFAWVCATCAREFQQVA